MLSVLLISIVNQSAGSGLAAPFLATAAGKPIKVDVGHASPVFTDFDGDKLPDLLVGQFGEGKLRIYRNVGTRTQPKFGQFTWFQAGGKIAQADAG